MGKSWKKRTTRARSSRPLERSQSCTRPGTCTTTCSSASTSSCPAWSPWTCSMWHPPSSVRRWVCHMGSHDSHEGSRYGTGICPHPCAGRWVTGVHMTRMGCITSRVMVRWPLSCAGGFHMLSQELCGMTHSTLITRRASVFIRVQVVLSQESHHVYHKRSHEIVTGEVCGGGGGEGAPHSSVRTGLLPE
jgi:hypothetical protein